MASVGGPNRGANSQEPKFSPSQPEIPKEKSIAIRIIEKFLKMMGAEATLKQLASRFGYEEAKETTKQKPQKEAQRSREISAFPAGALGKRALDTSGSLIEERTGSDADILKESSGGGAAESTNASRLTDSVSKDCNPAGITGEIFTSNKVATLAQKRLPLTDKSRGFEAPSVKQNEKRRLEHRIKYFGTVGKFYTLAEIDQSLKELKQMKQEAKKMSFSQAEIMAEKAIDLVEALKKVKELRKELDKETTVEGLKKSFNNPVFQARYKAARENFIQSYKDNSYHNKYNNVSTAYNHEIRTMRVLKEPT